MVRADRLPRRELLAKLSQYESGLVRGRQLGADVQRIASTLRHSLIFQAVNDLLGNPETGKWRDDAIVSFLFDRQCDIGLRRPYALSTFDRLVRKAIAKARANGRQSDT